MRAGQPDAGRSRMAHGRVACMHVNANVATAPRASCARQRFDCAFTKPTLRSRQAVNVINHLAVSLDIAAAMESVRDVALQLLNCDKVTLFLVFDRHKELRCVPVALGLTTVHVAPASLHANKQRVQGSQPVLSHAKRMSASRLSPLRMQRK